MGPFRATAFFDASARLPQSLSTQTLSIPLPWLAAPSRGVPQRTMGAWLGKPTSLALVRAFQPARSIEGFHVQAGKPAPQGRPYVAFVRRSREHEANPSLRPSMAGNWRAGGKKAATLAAPPPDTRPRSAPTPSVRPGNDHRPRTEQLYPVASGGSKVDASRKRVRLMAVRADIGLVVVQCPASLGQADHEDLTGWMDIPDMMPGDGESATRLVPFVPVYRHKRRGLVRVPLALAVGTCAGRGQGEVGHMPTMRVRPARHARPLPRVRSGADRHEVIVVRPRPKRAGRDSCAKSP